ncbi:uncharacterized protein TNCV_909631 [Trichonephila clavipes]|nr:uncharacterized protein TNCV_909631 [Trichonephila clavipes]
MPVLKVSKSNGLLQNYPSECNTLFIHGLQMSPRFFESNPIGRTCAHYSEIADDKFFMPTSLVNLWMQQLKVQGVLWLTAFKSVTLGKRLLQTEWNVDPPKSKSIHQWKRTLNETETLVSQTG